MSSTFTLGEYISSQLKSYVSSPPKDSFNLGRMSHILELSGFIGYNKSDAHKDAQVVFAKIAPQITANNSKRRSK